MSKKRITSPSSVEIAFEPNREKVEQAIKIASKGYKRALIKRLKEQEKPEGEGA